MDSCKEVNAVVVVCAAKAEVEKFFVEVYVLYVLFAAHPSVSEVGVDGQVVCYFYVAVCRKGYFGDGGGILQYKGTSMKNVCVCVCVWPVRCVLLSSGNEVQGMRYRP